VTNEYHLLVYQMKLKGIKKVKYEKTIRSYRIRGYEPDARTYSAHKMNVIPQIR